MMPEKDTAAVSFCKSELRVLPKTRLFPLKTKFQTEEHPSTPSSHLSNKEKSSENPLFPRSSLILQSERGTGRNTNPPFISTFESTKLNLSMKAFVFPGQGAQFVGMGKDLYEKHPIAKQHFEQANEILGFRITDIMFSGTDEELKQTKVTQPAMFLHSVVSALCLGSAFEPAMVAGHSLGELSALTAARCLNFEDGLKLVAARAIAMQKACEARPGTMAAIIALADEKVEEVCAAVREESGKVVVPANYNCPGQLVISGEAEAIDIACQRLKEAGAKRALVLPVSGAFHSPLMLPAQEELEKAIAATEFHTPVCPVYQNVDAKPHTDPEEIKANLIAQLTASVRWTEEVQNMVADGATSFTECGPGKTLQGMIAKICKGNENVSIHGVND